MGLALAGTAQNRSQGGISPEMMRQIVATSATQQNKALSNAMATNSIDDLARNYRNNKVTDTHFSIETPKQSIHNQRQSGRCWMYSSFNVLRANFARRHADSISVEFSHDYLFFYDQLEKSNLFLQAMIDTYRKPMTDQEVEWLFKNPLSDGGQFTGVANLIDKYGLVPAEAMPETYNTNNTSSISSLISLKLREYGLELREKAAQKGMTAAKLEQRKTEMLATVYRMLALTMGEPPQRFTWQQKDAGGKVVEVAEYTPMEFYRKFAQTDFSKYYMVMNDPTREYYKVYEIQYDRHVYDGQNWRYLNLPMEDIAPMCIASIKDSTMMYFSCDVGKFLDSEKGLMDMNNYDYESLLGTTFGMDKRQRVSTFASGSSHAMTLCAVDLDKEGKPVKWMVENSWGIGSGWQGNLIMTNEWFNEYMFRVVLEEKYIPARILEMMNQKPVMLPAWDPMFAPEE